MFALIQEWVFSIVEEAGSDNPVEAFTEQRVREYKYYLTFCVLKNRFVVTKSICASSLKKSIIQNQNKYKVVGL